jgi:hypothetical protein
LKQTPYPKTEAQMASGYTKIIVNATGCSLREADQVEEIMRDVIFHSTLDWQTREELEAAAKTAYAVLQELDESVPQNL